MKHPFLEVSYRKGKPFAGYLHLTEPSAVGSCRTEELRPGILLDIAPDGEAMWIEFLSPGKVKPDDLQAIRERFGEGQVAVADLAPIMAK